MVLTHLNVSRSEPRCPTWPNAWLRVAMRQTCCSACKGAFSRVEAAYRDLAWPWNIVALRKGCVWRVCFHASLTGVVCGHGASAAHARESTACVELLRARFRVLCNRSASLPGTPRSKIRWSIRSSNHFFLVSALPRQMCLYISVWYSIVLAHWGHCRRVRSDS